MSVLGRPHLKRQDIIISTVADQSIGFRWWRSPDGGRTREPVDLTGYTGIAELRAPDGTSWGSLPVICDTSGLANLATTPDTFTNPVWRARRNGEYSILITGPTGTITQLASGYLYLSH